MKTCKIFPAKKFNIDLSYEGNMHVSIFLKECVILKMVIALGAVNIYLSLNGDFLIILL